MNFNFCHCKMCQKFHGAPFGPYLWFKDSEFEIKKGEILKHSINPAKWPNEVFVESVVPR